MNDPMEPSALSERVVALLTEKKAIKPLVLEVGRRTTIADYFVIAAGRAPRHCQALYDHVYRSLKQEGVRPLRVEGVTASLWILLDFGAVVVHIFDNEMRNVFNLEELWGGEE